MTRYARAGKGTHNRVAKDPTPWNELLPPKPERVRGAPGADGGEKRFPNKNRRKERFNKGKRNFPNNRDSTPTESHNDDTNEKTSPAEMSDQAKSFKKSKNANIRGFGQSKSVKLLGQFWVPLEDGKRLKKLLHKLKSQGLPRKEILEALKNERRKAEKASKRQRDKTCFQCRQFGHILSDCPNLRKASVGDDLKIGEEEDPDAISDQGLVCFKCGSTEHTSRNCRRKGENFEFAKCFICSGSGHIARQCPKNSHGIYPSGGSCGECGSTGHLKMNCPDLVGIEPNPSGNDKDDAAVTLRMSDPFSSTEYEPVYDLGGDEKKDVEEETNEGDVDSSAATVTAKVVTTKQAPGKKKGKRKRDVDEGPSTFDFDFGNNHVAKPAINKPLFANRKRKVVKF